MLNGIPSHFQGLDRVEEMILRFVNVPGNSGLHFLILSNPHLRYNIV